jgi:hypothetical protein
LSPAPKLKGVAGAISGAIAVVAAGAAWSVMVTGAELFLDFETLQLPRHNSSNARICPVQTPFLGKTAGRQLLDNANHFRLLQAYN